MLPRIVALVITTIFALTALVPVNTFACTVNSSGFVSTRATSDCDPGGVIGHYTQYNTYHINWSDTMGQDTEMSGEGECQILPSVNCRPHFYQPYYGTSPDLATFNVTIDNVVATGGYICSLDYTVTKSVVHRCNTNMVGGCNGPTLSNGGCSSGFVAVGGICTRSDQFQSRCAEPTYYDDYSCTCPDGTTTSPIIIDV